VKRRDDVLAIVLALAAAAPLFVHRGDLLTSAAKALLLLLAAMGLNVAMGYAGSPSLGQGGFAAIGAYTTAILVARHHWDPVAATIVAVSFSLVAAAIVARGVSHIRPPFVALATWLFSWATAFAIGAFPMLTGGDNGISVGQPALRLHALGVGRRPGPPAYYEIALVAVAIVLVLHTNWTRRYGPALAAVRADPAAARASGVPVDRLRFGALTASGAIGGLAGALLALNAGVADPTSYGPLLSVKLFIVVLIGGAARRLGPAAGLVAVLLITRVASGAANALGSSAADIEPIVAGAVLAGLLVFGGDGLVDVIERRRATRRAAVSGGAIVPVATVFGAALKARDVRVAFGGVVALDDCTIAAAPGTCHAIIGPNGSGKTTLLRVLGGAVAPERGAVAMDGRELPHEDPASRARRGILRTLQRTAVQQRTTALDYVLAGAEPARPPGFLRAVASTPAARREHRDGSTRAREALAAVGLADVAAAPMETMTGAQQRLLQIARALAADPRVLLLDEPSAGFGADAEGRLREVLTMLRDAGLTVIVVEHNLRLVRDVADRVSVLDAGRVIAEGSVTEVANDPAVRAAYLGDEADRMRVRAAQNDPSDPDPARPPRERVLSQSDAAGSERGDRGRRAARARGAPRATDRARNATGGGADQRGRRRPSR
jgi:ABC-type branched-subunit amino acid transport system ATPase component/ABC-type branched-subunit amino acid transport system permease subunit